MFCLSSFSNNTTPLSIIMFLAAISVCITQIQFTEAFVFDQSKPNRISAFTANNVFSYESSKRINTYTKAFESRIALQGHSNAFGSFVGDVVETYCTKPNTKFQTAQRSTFTQKTCDSFCPFIFKRAKGFYIPATLHKFSSFSPLFTLSALQMKSAPFSIIEFLPTVVQRSLRFKVASVWLC